MNNMRILIVFFIGSLICFGQNSGQVTYVASINQQNAKNNKKLNKTVKDLISNAQDVEFSLVFSKTESLYQKEKTLKNDASTGNINIVDVFAGGNREVYFNSKEKYQIDKISVGEENFLVRKNSLNWKITKETKVIGKYNCLKAILLDQNKDETKTIAWFTNDIPVNFGPNFYNNLPGLVVRVEDNMLIYSAKNISISKEDKKIEKPSGGESITYEEFKERFSGFLSEE